MLGRRVVYLLALVTSVVFYWAYREWMAWLLLMAVVAAPWVSLLVSLPFMKAARLEAYCPPWIPMGSVWGVWLRGKSRLPLPLYRGRIRITRTLTGESWVADDGVALPTDHCGQILCQPEKLRIYDYLCLNRIKIKKTVPSRTLVRPRPIPIPTPPDLSRYMDRAWRPKAGGGFSENHELRLYRPGDSLNQVHWKLTAKTGKFIIREPMEPQRNRMVLTMDLKGTSDQLDILLGNTLWLGTYLLERGFPHELRVLTGAGVETFPVRSRTQLSKTMDHLLKSSPAGERTILQFPVSATWQYHIGGGQ